MLSWSTAEQSPGWGWGACVRVPRVRKEASKYLPLCSLGEMGWPLGDSLADSVIIWGCGLKVRYGRRESRRWEENMFGEGCVSLSLQLPEPHWHKALYYLFIWLHQVFVFLFCFWFVCLVAACRILGCGIWDLVPWLRIEPRVPCIGSMESYHWTRKFLPQPSIFEPLDSSFKASQMHPWTFTASGDIFSGEGQALEKVGAVGD